MSSSARFQRGLREQRGDKLLAHVESEGALRVRHLRGGYGGSVFCGRQPVLALFSTLKQIADADVELNTVIQIG